MLYYVSGHLDYIYKIGQRETKIWSIVKIKKRIVTFGPKHIETNLQFFTLIKYFSRCIISDATIRVVLKYTEQEFNMLSTIFLSNRNTTFSAYLQNKFVLKYISEK